VALSQLAEQDPLISVRQDDARREFTVSLYGEVQKQVIQATLADEFGVAVEFRETTPICIERPAGAGEAFEELGAASNPFLATVGLRIDPAPIGAGTGFRAEVGIRSVPMYVYKTFQSFTQSMEQTVDTSWRGPLRMAGGRLHGDDDECGYYAPGSTAADFRKLTPMVLMRALERAGTVVCEPIAAVSLEIPAGAAGAVLPVLARLRRRRAGRFAERRDLCDRGHGRGGSRAGAAAQLPGLTGGEGVLESGFGGYRPVSGSPPGRRRTAPSPLNREGTWLIWRAARPNLPDRCARRSSSGRARPQFPLEVRARRPCYRVADQTTVEAPQFANRTRTAQCRLGCGQRRRRTARPTQCQARLRR